jgi:hypothetical protein
VKAQNNVGEKITYALTASPAGMTIDTTTGLIAWSAPTEGSHQVSVRASITSGGKTYSATQSFTLVVTRSTPPLTIIFTSNPPLTGIEGKPYTYAVKATASDTTKTVLFRLAANAPSGMTLVTGTNVITWPSPVRGSYPITIIARVQGDTLLERQTYTLVISPDTTTSVNDDELGHSLRAYPNPASDRITIESASPLRNDAIAEILDARGQVVRRMTFQRGESRIAMDVQDIPSGSYAVRVTIGDTIVSLPAVLTR